MPHGLFRSSGSHTPSQQQWFTYLHDNPDELRLLGHRTSVAQLRHVNAGIGALPDEEITVPNSAHRNIAHINLVPSPDAEWHKELRKERSLNAGASRTARTTDCFKGSRSLNVECGLARHCGRWRYHCDRPCIGYTVPGSVSHEIMRGYPVDEELRRQLWISRGMPRVLKGSGVAGKTGPDTIWAYEGVQRVKRLGVERYVHVWDGPDDQIEITPDHTLASWLPLISHDRFTNTFHETELFLQLIAEWQRTLNSPEVFVRDVPFTSAVMASILLGYEMSRPEGLNAYGQGHTTAQVHGVYLENARLNRIRAQFTVGTGTGQRIYVPPMPAEQLTKHGDAQCLQTPLLPAPLAVTARRTMHVGLRSVPRASREYAHGRRSLSYYPDDLFARLQDGDIMDILTEIRGRNPDTTL